MSAQDRLEDRAEEAGESASAPLEESPERLPAKAWLTVILFAAFVVAGSSCIVGNLIGW